MFRLKNLSFIWNKVWLPYVLTKNSQFYLKHKVPTPCFKHLTKKMPVVKVERKSIKSSLWIRHCEMSFCFCTVKQRGDGVKHFQAEYFIPLQCPIGVNFRHLGSQ